MRDILDIDDFWVGTPDGAQVFGNKAPFAIDDTFVVGVDSGPVSIDVLANDFDPEGQPLTLISAFAGLGTAVVEADNTVTYTPPTGISGFDSVVYEIADDVDQRQTGQINITIAEIGFSLAVDTETDNTLSVTADTGPVTIDVTQPSNLAGSYAFNTGDLSTGPANLVLPTISGALVAGNVLSVGPGLWVYDSATSAPVRSYQWRRGGVDIAGETSTSYTVQSADLSTGVSIVETATTAAGARSAQSASLGSAAFTPSDDTQILRWWDAADTASITTNGGTDDITEWADQLSGAVLGQSSAVRRPTSNTRTQNGLNLVNCSGASFLERTETFPASGNIAFHGVFIVDAIDNAFEALFSANATADFQLDSNNATQFDGRLNATSITGPFNLSGGPFSGAFVLSAVFDLTDSGTVEVFVSNQSRGQGAYVTALDTSAVLALMTNRSQNAYVDGAVAEFILSENLANRADYHSYLATKWGLV